MTRKTVRWLLIAGGFALPHAVLLWVYWLSAIPLKRGEMLGSHGLLTFCIGTVIAFGIWVNTDD